MELPDRWQQHDVFVDGLRIHAVASGQGDPTVVLLHGFGLSCVTWHAVGPALAQDRRVVAFDRIGFGQSDRPLEARHPNAYGMEMAVRSTLGVMDALGLPEAVLVGSSAGGAVAVATALASPERIKAIALVDAPLSQPVGLRVLRLACRLPGARRALALALGAGRGIYGAAIRAAWHENEGLAPEVAESHRLEWFAPAWEHALVELTAADFPHDLEVRLPQLTAPALVVTGDRDRFVRPERSSAVAQKLPNALFVKIDSCGHLPHEERPEEFIVTLNRFLVQL
jgi:pimeloyl-ACP methyl ester carboxylesterase